jgi:hypothetical protein
MPLPPLIPSSECHSTMVQPRRAASVSMVVRWAARPAPLMACSSVLTRVYATTVAGAAAVRRRRRREDEATVAFAVMVLIICDQLH